MSLGFSLQGSKELTARLKGLATDAKEKLLGNAVRKGAKVVEKAMKSNIKPFKVNVRSTTHKGIGTAYNESDLKRTIGIVKRTGTRGIYYVIGPKVSKNEPGFLGVWLEYGTLAKRTEPLRNKRTKGAVAAAAKGLGLEKKPFARRSVEGSKTLVLMTMQKSMETDLAKIAKQ